MIAASLVSLPTFETYSSSVSCLCLLHFLLADTSVLNPVLFWWLHSSSILEDTSRHSVTLAFGGVTYDMMEWNIMVILMIYSCLHFSFPCLSLYYWLPPVVSFCTSSYFTYIMSGQHCILNVNGSILSVNFESDMMYGDVQKFSPSARYKKTEILVVWTATKQRVGGELCCCLSHRWFSHTNIVTGWGTELLYTRVHIDQINNTLIIALAAFLSVSYY